VRLTAVGALAVRPPKYTGNCCRSLQSTSYRDSPLIPKSTFNNVRTCHKSFGGNRAFDLLFLLPLLFVRGYLPATVCNDTAKR
jgi:hypothetical protein